MLHKAHLTSHSKITGSRWVITPLWLSGSWRSLLHSSSVYYCHLFLIFSASVRSIPFPSFIVPKCSLGISNFLEEFSRLSYSIAFLYFLHWSLWKVFLSLLATLWNFAFKWVNLSFSPLLLTSLLFAAICKAYPDSCFAFLHFFFLRMALISVSCTVSRISVHIHQALCLSDLVP